MVPPTASAIVGSEASSFSHSLLLLPTLLVYDLYHGFMLNSAWLIAVIDEVRGARMRWS